MAKLVERPVTAGRFKHVKLTVDTKPLAEGKLYDEMHAEMDKSNYSITPTTLKSRGFFQDHATAVAALDLKSPSKSSSGAAAASDDKRASKEGDVANSGVGAAAAEPDASIPEPKFYMDTYYHKTWNALVFHFGINGYNSSTREALCAHNIQQTEFTTRALTKLAEESKSASSKKSNASSTSNASNPKIYPKFIESIKLTSYEEKVIDLAFKHLTDTGKKTALVEIFPRAFKADSAKKVKIGDIEVPPEGIPLITHTVVLYQNKTTEEILVIDPNNPKFSGHLKHIEKATIVVDESPSDLHKIYSPAPAPNRTGPHTTEYRDCIDLSAKLAALLEKDATNYSSHDEIIKSGVVKMVSNTEAITYFNIPSAFRAKQSSSIDTISKANIKISDLYSSNKTKVQTLHQKLKDDLKPLEASIQQLRAAHSKEMSAISIEHQKLEVSLEQELIGLLPPDINLDGGNDA